MNSTKYGMILFILEVFRSKDGYYSPLGHLEGHPLKMYYLLACNTKGFLNTARHKI